MCLGGPTMPDFSQHQSPVVTRPDPPKGPPSPADMVNNMTIEPTDTKEVKKTTSPPSQSSKNPGMY